MREIKFRAWNNREKVMSLLRGFDFLIKQAIINCPNEKSKTAISSWDYKDKEIKLMQFTGLQDKNGVDIYEGDIIKGIHSGEFVNGRYRDRNGNINTDIAKGIITFRRGAFHIKYESNESTIYIPIVVLIERFSEVIGNIYENPELLEVGEY